jgi:hypothetical protein
MNPIHGDMPLHFLSRGSGSLMIRSKVLAKLPPLRRATFLGEAGGRCQVRAVRVLHEHGHAHLARLEIACSNQHWGYDTGGHSGYRDLRLVSPNSFFGLGVARDDRDIHNEWVR